MSRLKFLKLGRFIKFIFAISAMLLISLPVFAEIRMTIPTVATISSVNLEQGATFRVTISYKNTTPNTVKIAAMKFYLKYDKDKLSIYNARILTPVGLGYYFFQSSNYDFSYEVIDETAGKIQLGFVSKLGIPELEVAPTVRVPLLTLTFHVNKNALAADGQSLVWWWDEFGPGQNITNYVFVKEPGDVNVSGDIVAIDNYNIKAGAAPGFAGLDTTPKGLYDGDKAGNKPSVGNTITLDWATNAQTASNMTLYKNGLVRYHIYRSDKGATPYVSFTLGDNDSYLFRDGAGNGTPTTGLNDGTAYTYKVTAVDNTDGGTTPDDLNFTSSDPKENDTATQTIVPTDTTPPGEVSGLTITPGDGKLTLNWTNPADADLGGIVIVRGEAALQSGTFAGADLTKSPPHGEIVAEGTDKFGGKVIFAGNAPNNRGTAEKQGGSVLNSYEDTDLTNGKIYYYKIFTYDQAVGNTPGGDLVQMGRNYSSGMLASATPGVAPGAIANFYAVSRAAENEITLKWDNAGDYATKPQGGTVIWYTTDIAGKWTNIPNTPSDWPNSVTTEKMNLLRIEPRSDENETGESIVLAQDAAGTALSTAETYFFKAFTYNKTPTDLTADALKKDVNVIGTYRFSEPRYAAAAPTLAGGITVATGTKTFSFKGPVTDTKKPGINTFSIPFVEITSPSGLKTAEDFVRAVNSAAGKNVVTIFGYWDNVEKTFKGGKISYAGNNFDEGTIRRLNKVGGLVSDRNYQITVKEDVSLTVEGIYIK